MSIEQRMAELRQRFVAAASDQADQLERQLAAGDTDAAKQLAHGLAGRSGMFGFDELGDTAREVDEASPADLGARARLLIAALRSLA